MAPYRESSEQHPSPSLPPSPPPPRLRRKKKADSFESLANAPVPASPDSVPEDATGQESLWSIGRTWKMVSRSSIELTVQIFLTPVLFASFLLSLLIVDYRYSNRAHRKREHSAPTSTPAYLYPSTWLGQEPHRTPRRPSWSRTGSAEHVEPHTSVGSSKRHTAQNTEPGHLSHRIRKTAKLQIKDALEMQGLVLGLMVLMALICTIAVFVMLRWFFVLQFFYESMPG